MAAESAMNLAFAPTQTSLSAKLPTKLPISRWASKEYRPNSSMSPKTAILLPVLSGNIFSVSRAMCIDAGEAL
ncbi:MAG: hypothetical protein A2746_01740 [Candidatus Yanofskybacteria bacterium RIFCSPHIGHO2_01_FULL_44_22]|uniref:Uncharacterized protein n=1 Tax=Candidatus Yanofskybacteria bacterium RIFCSPHIGHO2_01_FULL_44_22 TaxID=1802669 RepID=A0A1F8EVT9_9BACT|nr:MAG: hypothetical protein A2746_01740 [Candidatus Yanofskybacteria bacterium RIFCSPHIGHO2_01_FULL_44_22]